MEVGGGGGPGDDRSCVRAPAPVWPSIFQFLPASAEVPKDAVFATLCK